MQVIEAQSFWSWRLTITCISTMSERPQQVIDPEPSGHDPPIGDLVLAFEAPAVDAEQNLDAVADLLDSLSWCYSPIELGE